MTKQNGIQKLLHLKHQPRQQLKAWLETRAVVLMDGAMGTELLRRYRGLKAELLSVVTLSHPDWVRSVHRAYLRSGAQCLLANTFLAWPRESHAGSLHYFRKMNRLAIRLARESGPDLSGAVPILASIGPWLNNSADSAKQCLAQLHAVRQVDAVLLETQSSLTFAEKVLAELPSDWTIPILVSFTFRLHGKRYLTWPQRHTPTQIAKWADTHRSGIAVLGVNCGYQLALRDITRIVCLYRRETDLPILVRPNAGTPQRHGSKHIYPISSEDFAAAVPDWLDAGANWLGGCCGTTPRHIAAMRRALRQHKSLSSALQ